MRDTGDASTTYREEAEFGRLVEPFRSALRTHCYRLTGSLDDAEDLVQETFLRAWRRRETLADPAALKSWLYRIATNACLDAIDRRRVAARRTLPLHVVPPSDPERTPAPPVAPPDRSARWPCFSTRNWSRVRARRTGAKMRSLEASGA